MYASPLFRRAGTKGDAFTEEDIELFVSMDPFGTLDGHTTDFFAPEAGVIRALDVALNDYQGGEDFIGGWDPTTAQQLPGFPAEVNDP